MTPENTGYMIAAYVVTAVVIVVYAAWLSWRVHRAMREGREDD